MHSPYYEFTLIFMGYTQIDEKTQDGWEAYIQLCNFDLLNFPFSLIPFTVDFFTSLLIR